MKKLKALFTSNPSYTKWGNLKISEFTGIVENTVKSFKKSADFKEIKKSYLSNLKARNAKKPVPSMSTK